MAEQVDTKLADAYARISGNKPEATKECNPPGIIEKGLPTIETAVSKGELVSINEELVKWPEGFTPNKN